MATGRDILKTYFETGDMPTEQQFAELIDSLMHVDSDRGMVRHVIAGQLVTIPITNQHVILGNMVIDEGAVLVNHGQSFVQNGVLQINGAVSNNGLINLT